MPPRAALRLVCALLAPFVAGPLAASGLLVAFQGPTDGGVARIDLDARGQPSAPVVIFRHPAFTTAAKLRVSADARHATLNAAHEGGENFAILDLPPSEGTAVARLVALDFLPEEHRLAGSCAYVGGTDGHVVVIDLATGTVSRRWNTRRDLSPAGHKPEDLLVVESADRLLVSQQKDGKKGRLGGRVTVLRLSDFSLVSDLMLPRDQPDLHISEKESGPSPETIRSDLATNTLVIALDLYGALAFADLDAALAGKLKNYAAVPSSADGAWGKAFPDRFALARIGERTLAVVSNASAGGGLAVFDVGARRRVAFYPVEAGCAEPVSVKAGRTLATVVSGKRKRVAGASIENVTTPGGDLLLLDLAGAAAGVPSALTRAPLGGPVAQVSGVPGHADLVAVTVLSEPRLLICSAEDGRIHSSLRLPGRPAALQPLP